MSFNPDVKLKILLIGSGRVGKTSLARKFVEKQFQKDYLPTIGVNLMAKDFTIDFRGKALNVRLALWDLAGQESFKSLLPAYYRGLDGVFFVADLTSPESFETLPLWHADLKRTVSTPVPTILLANKCDLPARIEEKTIQDSTQRVGASACFKTSAKIGDNVLEAFNTITLLILEKNNAKGAIPIA